MLALFSSHPYGRNAKKPQLGTTAIIFDRQHNSPYKFTGNLNNCEFFCYKKL